MGLYPLLQDILDSLEIAMTEEQEAVIAAALNRAYDRGCNDEYKRVKGDEA